MRSVARGDRKASGDAAQPSFESVEAVIRLLTPENRHLLATIEQNKPESIADLARLVMRAEPNVSRTLGKLEACGFVRLRQGVGKAKIPERYPSTDGRYGHLQADRSGCGCLTGSDSKATTLQFVKYMPQFGQKRSFTNFLKSSRSLFFQCS